MTYLERKELDTLSKEVFGTTSRWRKLLARGDRRNVTYGERKSQKHKIKSTTEVKSFTRESVKAYMLELKAQTEAAKREKNSTSGNAETGNR
jgi:hypothetical protein